MPLSADLERFRAVVNQVEQSAGALRSLAVPVIDAGALPGSALGREVTAERVGASVTQFVVELTRWAVTARGLAAELEVADVSAAVRLPR